LQGEFSKLVATLGKIFESAKIGNVRIIGYAFMIRPRTQHPISALLLVAAASWVFAVTLCFTQTGAARQGHDHPISSSGAPCHDGEEPGCSCETFNSFPVQPARNLGIEVIPPEPVGPIFITSWDDALLPPFRLVSSIIQSTGPPERLSFAELVLQRSVQSHAPPVRS
jgi:hypothetical protein